ncbi:aminodeoxychorismate synthase component I [Runella sp. MFBS21]|uniref:aminodeoxychorismate synthase component I n=1 Tax=Runella sp. MFBS21 TaxID=3034018 RepID=UPI0023F8FFBB|nr:aminodeoxychorismate synthase component I [Runella sp. MFBS21]MDF7820288.1 aminodeoxychorismate synthase component I [Runella sp. MFBS21]
MIQTLSTADAIQRMNDYGHRRIPFLFIIDFLTKKPIVLALKDIDHADVLYDFNGKTNAPAMKVNLETSVFFHKHPLPLESYQPKFEYVVNQLKRGNSFLVNLSICTKIETNLDLKGIFLRSRAKYKLWWAEKFVCFSPEIFVQVKGDRIASFPMKGTIDADIVGAERLILSNLKEAAEHATIVDLIRNDLSMVAQKVWVERYRYVDTIRTNQKSLLQVSSEIAGKMPLNWRETLGDWLFRLLPAGSISGAPKPRTLEIIQEAEGYERGYYTGIAGIFDGENLDSGVLIRFIENIEGQLTFKSGGGITARSEALPEYQEVLDKVYLPFLNELTPIY